MSDAGIFLPCNVLIYQNEDMSTTDSTVHPLKMFPGIDHETIVPINTVNEIFVNVFDKLVSKFS